ncbi:Oberon, PHD finger domain [Sesbania bispinosa]|nr:Oberon, PHD finger domain [Sesbania bispinosa]
MAVWHPKKKLRCLKILAEVEVEPSYSLFTITSCKNGKETESVGVAELVAVTVQLQKKTQTLLAFKQVEMDLEEKFLVKVSGVQSLSSSVQSTPEKNGHSDDGSRSSELLQEFLKCGPKKELLRTCFDKDKKNISSKSKMIQTKSTGDSCGLSCHIECALQHGKVGVVDHGQLMQLDGGYCCASCGKVTGILGCWKKQLNIAKDARRVDVLCYRIYLSYKLLDGTSKFKDLHQMVQEAKAKLEAEVGPVDGVSANMARGIVSRLPIASDVQKLCSLAIEKADSWLATLPTVNPDSREGSLPAACKFVFEEVTTSSVKIILIEMSNICSEDIKGYKLWYYKSREESPTKDPVSVFPKSQRRILISNLQPCTEYTFRIISYTDAGDLGHSEAKCFTKSINIIHNNPSSSVAMNHKKENLQNGGNSSGCKMELNPTVKDSGFKVRDLGKILRLAWAQEQGYFEEFCCDDKKNCCGQSEMNKPKIPETQLPSDSRGLDLNVASVPDLNEEITPPFESSRDEDNGCTLLQAVEADDDAASHDLEKNGLARSHGSGDSQTWPHGPTGEVSAVDSRRNVCRKRIASTNEETQDSDSTLINGSPLRISDASCSLDESFEYCVKVIRWLECEGHIKQEFRLKLLTWFSLRSTEQERRVVNTFIQTLIDDPGSLAGQLVDTFSDIISSKRPRNGFCSKAVASN